MGSGTSRMDTGPNRRSGPKRRRWPSVRSVFLCGASSSREMENHPAELRVNSAQHGRRLKLKHARTNSNLSMSSCTDLISIKSENGVSSGDGIVVNKNSAPEAGSSGVERGGRGKGLSQSRELVPFPHSAANSRDNQTASSSYVDQSSPDYVSANEGVGMNTMSGELSQVRERTRNSNSVYSRGPREHLLDEAAVENNLSETTDVPYVNSDSSIAPDSLVDYHTVRRDTREDVVIPPGMGFIVSESEPNLQDGSVLQVDVLGLSSNILSGNPAALSGRDIRRNSRRLFWDAFSRRGSRRHSDSRTFIFSPDSSGHFRSHDRWLLDFDGDLLNDEAGTDFNSHGSRTLGSNEPQWNSRSEIWDRLRGGLDSTDHRSATCPRGIHADGRCLCQSSLSAVESGARAGISRIVMLAEALFEVLDQIHRQPMSLSLSMVSLPAPESVVDSFPVKTHRKIEKLERADDVLQCYICLSEYEEGDKIRVLPCHHEYHVPCVDKWLKEVHGVCPLCRGDVRDGLAETNVQIE